MKLEAQRRWCLTGTPVQNRLEDLFALIKFLRFQPFDNVSTFRKHILGPLSKSDGQGLENLRLVMKAIAIRRTKGATGISGRSEKLVPVELSLTERSQYEGVRNRGKQLLLESSRSGCSQPSPIILKTIFRLRQLCSYGHFDIIRGLDNTQLSYNGTDSCNQCGIDISIISALEAEFHGQCGHRFCHDCYVQYTALHDGFGSPSVQACPLCDMPSAESEETMVWANDNHNGADMHMVDAPDPQDPWITSSKISRVISQLLEIERGYRSDDSAGKR